MASKRCYHDGCAGAHALNLVGERWSLLVVRELLLGPKRFTDVKAGLPGISSNVLSQRLDELAASGVVIKRRLPLPAPVAVYDLTEWGRELETVICELGRWGARSPGLPRDEELGIDSMVLSLRTMFDPVKARGKSGRIELRFGPQVFNAAYEDGSITVERGDADAPQAIVTAPPPIFAAIVYDGASLDEAVESGDLTIEGNKAAVKRFTKLFSLPEPATPPIPVAAA